jgi:geranylgeranyl diphosphate synthase type I
MIAGARPALLEEEKMGLRELTGIMLPAIETALQQAVRRGQNDAWQELNAMLAYHLGWEGEGAGPEARGKRIRPLLVTLTAAACGGDWQAALPAAAAVELVHNFSLIHDDIEDHSDLRRGRPTVWTRWGIPQAINTGDALFSIAHLAILQLAETTDVATAHQAAHCLQETCLRLTQGQYLDIAYEKRNDLSLEAYWLMIGGKTAALLECCTALGAFTAHTSAERRQHYQDFGRSLGLAFQVQDDLLGIWGDAQLTGKSAESDLVAGKKSLPVVYGLQQGQEFARRWLSAPIPLDEVSAVARLLEAEGARAYAQQAADHLTQQALEALQAAQPQGEAGAALEELVSMLLKRNK